MKKKLKIILVLMFSVAAATSASATVINLQGVNYPDMISATVNFNYLAVDSDEGVVSVALSNASSTQSSLTGFAFNIPSNISALDYFSGLSGWNGVISVNNINTPGQLGYFDIAGISGSNFNGGKPNEGIWDGDSATFKFYLSGTGMNTLSAESFLGLKSSGAGGTSFVARFQAIGTFGGSDTAAPVPEPCTVSLLGGGLVLLAATRRRMPFFKSI